MKRRLALAALVFALLAWPAAAARGQDGSLELDLGASYALPPGGSLGEPTGYVNGGLRLAGQLSNVGYGHVGGYGGLSLTETGASWAAFAAGAGFVAPVSSVVSLGLWLSGEAFAVGDPFPYRAAVIRAQPELSIGRGSTVLRLRGYGGLGTSEVTVLQEYLRETRRGTMVVQVGYDVASDLWAWGGGVQLSHRAGIVVPTVTVEAYDSPQGPYAGGLLGLQIHFGGGALRIEGGVWDTPDGTEGVLVAGLEAFLGSSSLVTEGGRYGPDPLLDTPVAGSASAGVTAQLARFGPSPEGRQEVRTSGGRTVVTLVLRAPDAASVSVAGDFTDWMEVPMARGAGGWTVELPVEAGAYHYGFLVDGEWYVPLDATGRSEDEWGGTHATLIVPLASDGPVM